VAFPWESLKKYVESRCATTALESLESFKLAMNEKHLAVVTVMIREKRTDDDDRDASNRTQTKRWVIRLGCG
jgi:hypothetical protein